MVKVLVDPKTNEILSTCEGDNVSVGIEGRDDLVLEDMPDVSFESIRQNVGLLSEDKKMFKHADGKGIEIRVRGRLNANIRK